MQLTKNFSLAELTASQIAERKGINNVPEGTALDNLKRLAELLQECRDLLAVPIYINSGYRCLALNQAVGSSSTSQHLKGCAADVRVAGMSPPEVVRKIMQSNIEFDQIISEYHDPNRVGSGWVHISAANEPELEPRGNALIIDRLGTRAFA